jgi:hypothetical protein
MLTHISTLLREALVQLILTTTGSYIFHDYWVTLQKIHLFSNVFTLS